MIWQNWAVVLKRIDEELKRLSDNGQLRIIPNIISKSDGKIVVDAGEAWAKEAITVNSDINAD